MHAAIAGEMTANSRPLVPKLWRPPRHWRQAPAPNAYTSFGGAGSVPATSAMKRTSAW